jgi:hypothetical protein
MCGRHQRRSDKQHIAEAFALGRVDGLALELTPDYNVAPQTMQPSVPIQPHFTALEFLRDSIFRMSSGLEALPATSRIETW